jgi:hypothetical protein
LCPPLSAILTLIGDITGSYTKSYREISYIGAEIFYINRGCKKSPIYVEGKEK